MDYFLGRILTLLLITDRGDCKNYRGIFLLSTVGKTFARVILSRLQLLVSRIYTESQCGFRRSRSAIDMIFSIRQLQKKSREQKMPLYMAFIDLKKAFDLDKQVRGRYPPLSLLQKLETVLAEEWTKVRLETIRRIPAVLIAKGGSTPY
ncbi:uncharacterized protein LOC106870801 [Octopus bimaculoides]|uniref:uncharacterized protein LOC106870801 n=1 Tax=Octopus bimaculoides TaxID=37653 RepID=UPI00071CD7A4|nr:uncharacterized protein LOC106870801 [Octopus bimaculoides]|eukprot:XP_014772536.1 PREDICTED: uncharacterized protein LOC106870801 [Octopus bimaculoides]